MAVINHWGQSRVNDAIGLVSFGLNFATCTAFGAGAGEGGFPEEPGFEPGEPGGAPPEGEPPPNSGEGESITNCPLCFAAGTPVHTEHGNVPIELIKVGERVVARDQLTGKEELKPVTALVPEHKGTLVEVQIEGEQHTLRPSLAHPLWVKRSESDTGHWIEAKNLRPGELVETIDGGWRKIESVKYDDGKETVYNFTVAKDHDYFVGQTGFLVHNANCNRCDRGANHHIVAQNDWRAAGSRKILGLAGIGVNDPSNLINLLTEFHQHLHTDEYHAAVEDILTCAWNEGGADGVAGALEDIGEQLGNGNWIPK